MSYVCLCRIQERLFLGCSFAHTVCLLFRHPLPISSMVPTISRLHRTSSLLTRLSWHCTYSGKTTLLVCSATSITQNLQGQEELSSNFIMTWVCYSKWNLLRMFTTITSEENMLHFAESNLSALFSVENFITYNNTH